jgi:hypothetical protein
MRQLRTKWFLYSVLSGGLVLQIAVFLRYGPRTPAGPQSLQDAARLVEEEGLYWMSPHRSNEMRERLIVSDRPVSWEQANLVRFSAPQHPCWRGVVALCYPAHSYLMNYDADHSAVWGKLFVYGDPELIQRLICRDQRRTRCGQRVDARG